MGARNQINKEKQLEQTINISQLVEGDIVKFKGTRDRQGLRRIYRKSLYSYTCFQLMWKANTNQFYETGHTSINGIDKLSMVYRDGHFLKIVQ